MSSTDVASGGARDALQFANPRSPPLEPVNLPSTLPPLAASPQLAEESLLGPIAIKAQPVGVRLRSVAVFNTGGTIGMKANDEGCLVPVPGFLAERMQCMAEFSREEMPAVTLFELLPLLDSSDMGPDDWLRIAHAIDDNYTDYDAFVIIMGTDTMSYAASALSFILENLSKTVIITGSMLPLSDLFNDAQRNLIVSLVMAATLDIPEVCIFMDDSLLRGNRTVKVNSGGLDAFSSPNFPPLAMLETGIRFRPSAVLDQPKGRFTIHSKLETNIAVWRMIPGFDDEYIVNSIRHSSKLRAIVLELYGTGNVSSRKASLLDALSLAISKGIVIVATSQCLRGTVDLQAYALGAKLAAIGVLSGQDMTVEAVTCKLAYLLSWPRMNSSDLRTLMARSLRGEVTERGAYASTSTAAAAAAAAIGGGGGGGVGRSAGLGGLIERSSSPSPHSSTPSSHTYVSVTPASGGDVKISMESLSGSGRRLSSPHAASSAHSAAGTASLHSHLMHRSSQGPGRSS